MHRDGPVTILHWPSGLLGCILGCALAPSLVAGAGVMPQDPPPESQAAPATTAPPSPKPLVSGQLRSRYFLRWTGDDDDNDLVTTLGVDVGDPDKHDYTGHLMGRLAWDIDGRDSTFASINDSYGRPLDGLLYSAYVDMHRVRGLSLIRLGRQSIYETPEVAFFDGVHAASAELGDIAFQVGGYLGASTHLYEASHSGDLTAGAYCQLRPWSDSRFRLDYMHLEDDARLLSHRDGVLGAGFWQDLGRNLQFDAQYSRIERRDRDARGRLLWRLPEYGLFAQASYYNLLRTQGDLVLEADPFFNSLNELRPFDQWTVLAGKEIAKMLRLQAAADLRRVRDASDVGFYNRDYDHYYGTASLFDFGPKGLSLSGTIDYWDSDNQMVRGFSGDASYEIDATTLSAGTYYSLYKYDLFTNSERDHVRTYYFKLQYESSKSVTLESDYELEDDDFDQYHRFRLGVTWRF